MHASREPLGKILTRKLNSAAYTKTLPGAPDGEYVVIQYEAASSINNLRSKRLRPCWMMASGEYRVTTSVRSCAEAKLKARVPPGARSRRLHAGEERTRGVQAGGCVE